MHTLAQYLRTRIMLNNSITIVIIRFYYYVRVNFRIIPSSLHKYNTRSQMLTTPNVDF